MDITRRAFLGAGAAAGVSVLVPTGGASPAFAALPPGVTPFTERLPTLRDLGVVDMTNAAGGTARLEMVNGRHRFHAAMGLTDTFAYRVPGGDRSYLGPVLVARRGVPFDLVVRNRLAAHPLAVAIDEDLVPAGADDAHAPRTSTHLHGGNVAPDSDGAPLDTFVPGGSYRYHYANDQAAAGLWYHDHALGITRLNVYAGLAGGYLVRDHDDPGDGSVLPAPPFEVPLILQDRMFDADGGFVYPPNTNPTTPRPWAPEFFGDVATVNGKVMPNLDVRRGKYRFRVFNGSNARFYRLRLVDAGGHASTFFQIGSDGGLLDAPVPMKRLLLGPGERADLVVDFAGRAPGTKLTLTNDAPTPFPDGPRSVKLGAIPLRRLMRFTVTGGGAPWTQPLPRRLRSTPVTRLAGHVTSSTVRRTMSLVEILDGAGAPVTALLNNRTMSREDYASAPVGRNTLEQWELVNLTGDAHPIHLHFTQFQVLDRQPIDAEGYQEETYGPGELTANTGPYRPPRILPPVGPFLVGGRKPPPANERGWKDTVVALPGQVTRILVPFGPGAADGAPLAIGASYAGDYVWHCHILEHEDNDMMQRYRIE